MKKLLSILFASLVICSACIHPVAASTPSIVIDGGEVAGGGVASGTNAKGDVAALLASLVLSSQGVKVSLSNDSNLTPLEFVKNLMMEYAEKSGELFDSLCNQWISNVKVFADGLISIGMENSKKIYNFLSWLKESNSIVSSSGDYILIDGNMCPIVYPQNMIEISVGSTYNQTAPLIYKNTSTNQKYALFIAHYTNNTLNNYLLVGVTNDYGARGYFVGGLYVNDENVSSFGTSMTHINNFYSGYELIFSNFEPSAFSIPVINGHPQKILRSLNSFNVQNGTPEEDSLIGNSNNINPEEFNISDNEINIIDPGLDLSALALQSGLDGILQIKEYLKALINSVNGVDENVVKVNDSITGILQDVPIPDYNIYNSTSVTTETETEEDNGMNIIDNNALPDAETTQHYIQHMQFNLVNVFPFCIPFDIVNILSKLDVEPITPHVHFVFPNPILSDPIEFDLDFSQWDDVAMVVRNAELIAFVVGLAMVTRDLIRG